MQFADAPEDHVPVGTAKVGWASQTGDGVLVGVGVVDHDVGRVVRLNLGREVGVDLDAVVKVLLLDGEEQRAEPLKGAKVTADPEEVDLSQARSLLGVVHAVPDGLEDGGEGGHTDTGTDEDGDLVLEDILRGRSKGTINVHPRQHPAESRVGIRLLVVNTHNLALVGGLLVPVAAQRSGHSASEVTNTSHVDGDVVFLRSTGQSERVVLPQRDGGAAEENVLSGARLGVLLLDLDLADVARVLDDLGNVRLVPAANLAGNALSQINVPAVHPVLPENSNGRCANAGAEGRNVRLDHAEGTVDRPEEEEDDEHVVSVPEALVVGSAGFLDRGAQHGHEGHQHDISCPSGTRRKVSHQPAVEA